MRSSEAGTRTRLTAAEIADLEGAIAKEIEEGNEPTDPKGTFAKGGEHYRPAPARPTSPPAARSAATTAAGPRPATGDVRHRRAAAPRSSPRRTAVRRRARRTPRRRDAAPGGPAAGGAASEPSQYDNPEARAPRGERCIISFGRNGGPPMLPNGFYNNNYQIVQTADARGDRGRDGPRRARSSALNANHRTDDVRPWLRRLHRLVGGRHPGGRDHQLPARSQAYQGAWKNLKVTERFTRVGPDRLLYEFKVEDPTVVGRSPGAASTSSARQRPGLRIRLPRGQLRHGTSSPGRELMKTGPRDVRRTVRR